MAKLTSHVLDIYHGKPAANMKIQLWRTEPRSLIKEVFTNQDGRCDVPLLEGDSMEAAEFELLFFVRDYFGESESPFLNTVPIRFSIFDTKQNYHVPLLVSPWAFSSYRGS
jgi:5-hydroxyisourate hydrolase